MLFFIIILPSPNWSQTCQAAWQTLPKLFYLWETLGNVTIKTLKETFYPTFLAVELNFSKTLEHLISPS